MTRRRWRREVLLAVAALIVVLGVSGIAAASLDDDGVAPIDDLDLLFGRLDPDRSRLEDHLDFALGWLDPASRVDEGELVERFSPDFLDAIPIDELVVGRDDLLADAPYRVRGVLDRNDTEMALAVRGASGEDYVLAVAEQPGDRELIGGLTLFVDRPSPDPMTAGQLLAACVAATALALAALALALRRPAGPVALVAATAVVTVAQTGQLSSAAALFWIGLVSGPVALALGGVIAAALLTRPHPLVLPASIATMVLGTLPLFGVDTVAVGLPARPIELSINAARWLADARALAAIVVSVAIAVVAARVATLERRRRPTALTIIVAAAIVVVLASGWFVGGGRFDLTASAWVGAALTTIAAAVAVASLPTDDSSEVAQFVIDLGDDEPRSLEDSMRTALSDPSAELLYWSDELGTYVSQHGERRSLDQLANDRTVRPIRARDAPLAVVIHDATLAIDPHRLTAVVAAARLALEVERLQAEVRTRLGEVEASRIRIVEAGDQARRAVERDLHDGAQQRLLAVLLTLRRLQRHAGTTPFAAELDDAAHQLGLAVEELRSISRGLRPPSLDHGIGAALEALAESAPIPVEVEVEPGVGPLGERTETAVWFVASEAVTNTVRHAGATHARLRLSVGAGEVVLDVADDGCGGARLDAGTGLLRLRDRAEALGGRLELRSDPGAGTRLTLHVPLERPQEAGW